MSDDYKLPPGRQPYDQLSGLRVGAFAGGLVGAAVTAAAGIEFVWVILVLAAVGAAAGVWSQRVRRDSDGDG